MGKLLVVLMGYKAIMKLNQNGEFLWDEWYGGSRVEKGSTLIEVSDGYLAIGSTTSFSYGGIDGFLIKVDRSGELIYSRNYGDEGDQELFSFVRLFNGEFVGAGYTDSNGGCDGYLVKASHNLSAIWRNQGKAYGGNGKDYFNDVIETSDGYLIAVGISNSFSNSFDMYVVKTDLDGNEIKSAVFGGAGNDEAYSAIETPEGNLLIAGFTESGGNGSSDVSILKLDKNFQVILEKTFGGTGVDEARSLISVDDGYAMAGKTNSFSGRADSDVYVVKTDFNLNGSNDPAN